MNMEDAERYVLALINRDRAANGLPAVVWNETAAKAGRRHAADLAANGITSHVGTDGSVPEQRYTEAGGPAMVMENVGCLGDSQRRPVETAPLFAAESLERVQKAFMDEQPPHDGHRRNILSRLHVSVGVGLAEAKGLDIACTAQEFVDDFGDYDPVPANARVHDKVRVRGRLRAPATIAAVGISRVDPPKRKSPKDLGPRGYAIPKPYVMYWPAGYITPLPLSVDPETGAFDIEVPLDDHGRSGLYGVSVWATLPGEKDKAMVSLRTIVVSSGPGAHRPHP